MDQKNADKEPDQSPPEIIDDTAPPAPAATAPSSKAEKPQPSRLQGILRKVLVWMLFIVIVFSAGIAADHYLRYKPLSEANVETQTVLDQAHQDLSDMQAGIDRLNILNQEAGDNIAKLETDKKALQDEIEATTTHLKLLQVLVDVSNARVALFLENVEEAKTSLVNTQQRLENLLPRITEYDPTLAQDMSQRLNLIISGLDRDIETVKIDLELITKDLLGIEEAMFGD
ncbi:MAG: protein bicaudal D homolog [Anaerolineales bacterium]|nr:protein bicaudal D homolog [Anaerolineales bacterium]